MIWTPKGQSEMSVLYSIVHCFNIVRILVILRTSGERGFMDNFNSIWNPNSYLLQHRYQSSHRIKKNAILGLGRGQGCGCQQSNSTWNNLEYSSCHSQSIPIELKYPWIEIN